MVELETRRDSFDVFTDSDGYSGNVIGETESNNNDQNPCDILDLNSSA